MTLANYWGLCDVAKETALAPIYMMLIVPVAGAEKGVHVKMSQRFILELSESGQHFMRVEEFDSFDRELMETSGADFLALTPNGPVLGRSYLLDNR